MRSNELSDTELRYLTADGEPVETSLAEVDADRLAAGPPVRAFPGRSVAGRGGGPGAGEEVAGVAQFCHWWGSVEGRAGRQQPRQALEQAAQRERNGSCVWGATSIGPAALPRQVDSEARASTDAS